VSRRPIDISKEIVPELGEEQVNMLYLPDLTDKQLNTLHELLRRMVVKDVHVHPLVTAGKESRLIVLCGYAFTDASQDKSARVDRLEVSSRHLQSERICGWHNSH